VNAIAAVLNGGWAFVLVRQGRLRRSPALVADGIHLSTDVLTSAGVIVGLILAVTTGILVLDAVLAALMAFAILWQGWRLVRSSIGGLMDEAVDEETLTLIRGAISKNAAGAIEAHDLRTRQAGRMTFIEFHLVVPGSMAVSVSHDICDRIERALRAEVADALITIHVEPEEKAKHTGVVIV
jgi:cation diffusion facilitator family transporter